MTPPDFDEVCDSPVKSQWVYANKETVDWLLSINTRNRKKKEFQIKTLLSRIKTGQWRDVGDSIAVSASGFLINGQNRLEAIKEAGYPRVRFLMTTGLPDESIEATDQNAPRTTRDLMQLLLDKSVTGKLIACLNWLYYISSRQTHASNQLKPSPVMLLEWMERLQDVLVEYAPLIKTQRNTVSAPILAYAARNKSKADEFVKQLVYGVNLSIDDPAYRLREYLSALKGKGGGAFIQRETYEKTVAAILKHAAGQKCKQLNYPATGWDAFECR